MKRSLSVLLTLLITLCFLSPTLGAETDSYESDLRAISVNEGYQVERVLECGEAAAVLRWRCASGFPEVRDYELYLFYKDGRDPERLLLPSTVCLADGYSPTAEGPRELYFSEDSSALIYNYVFPQALMDGAFSLHEVGTYIYTVDLSSGELTLTHRAGSGETAGFSDVLTDDWFVPYVKICVEDGLMKGVGGGKFAPGTPLTSLEQEVLALRLYDLAQGGDGVFPQAPADWGYATLTLPDGEVLGQGYLNAPEAWSWTVLGRGGSGYPGFRLETEEERAWGKTLDYKSALFTLDGVAYPVTLHLNGSSFLYIPLTENKYQLGYAPTPQEWWRNAWYYAQQQGLTGLINGSNSRQSFAQRVAAVTDLPDINEVSGLPDTGDPAVLALYRAGILTGNDVYGTFDGGSTLTRAEAAAICARILRPELRIAFTPKPLETYESYTLTFLREDGVREGGPYIPNHSIDLLVPDNHTLLRLDGVELPLPEGYQVETIGDGLAGLARWDKLNGTESFGLMDSQGQFQACTREKVWENPRLGWFPYSGSGLHNGYETKAATFFNAQGEQVTPTFDWAGYIINDQGQGFVGMDGNIYRIEFQK